MRRALVIGAETNELRGVHNDVAMMSALLEPRGFTVDRRTGADATRAGILDGLERLLSVATTGDAVVIYYGGHGGMAEVTAPNGLSLPDLQVIVPTDYDASTPGDFRGITAIELSVHLARLAERTRNLVLILDCCHAGHMAKGQPPEGLVVRGRPLPSYLDVAEHIGMMRALGLRIDLLHPISNPHLVRVVACGPWGLAFEYTNQDGIPVGLATDSLRIALEEISTEEISTGEGSTGEAGRGRVTWAALAQRIRQRVSTLVPEQRPEVEGPARRRLFEVEEIPGRARFSVVRELPNRLSLPGAVLLGARTGDRLAVTPAGVDVADDTTTVAQATVTHTDGVNARATFELRPGHQGLPAVAEAHPVDTSQPGHPVTVLGDGPLADLLRSVIASEPMLQEVTPADRSAGDLRVRVDDKLALWDGGTVPLRTATADAEGVRRIRADLVRLALTAQLRRLAPEAGEELTDPFTVDWGQVVAGERQPLPTSGAQVQAGTPIYLRFRNDSDRALFFFAFDLGVTGKVTLLTAADPSGLRLRPRQEQVVGEREGVLTGFATYWPAGVPTADPRPETILTIVTSAPQDLGVLVTGEAEASRGSWSLDEALDRAARQETAPVDGPLIRYAVVHLNWQLSAGPAT